MSKPNQKQKTPSVVEMDAGRFLRQINIGAKSQLKLFEDRIRRMGEEAGSKWELVSLDSKSLVFEDVNNEKYYRADISRLKHNKVKVNNIQELRIIESKKEDQFHKNVYDMVTCLSEDDNKGAENAFNKITAQKYRSKVIPESGIVTTKDGISRKIYANKVVTEDIHNKIIKKLCENLSDRVKISRGKVVEAEFGGEKINVPMNELQRRRIVAEGMRQVAAGSFSNEDFQSNVYNVAYLVTEDKVKDAVRKAANYLKENQEFCLLDESQMTELVGYALASKNIMNEKLAGDVGKLYYQVNVRANKDTILKEWRETAKMTEDSTLVEEVRSLRNSKNLARDYDSFLGRFFCEDISMGEAEQQIYLTALKQFQKVLADDPDDELSNSIQQFIEKIESGQADDSTVHEVRLMVARAGENLINLIDTLDDYDQIPGEEEVEAVGEFGGEDLGDEEGEMSMPGGASLPMDMGEEEPEGELGEEEFGGEEFGEEGEGEGEGEGEEFGFEEGDEEEEGGGLDLDRLLAASKIIKGNVVSEAVKKGVKTGICECGSALNEEGVCTECNSAATAVGGVKRESLEKAVSELNEKQLVMELAEWVKNGKKFFKEDGASPCSVQLRAYMNHAKKLGNKKIFEAFRNILAKNLMEEIPEALKKNQFKPKDDTTDAKNAGTKKSGNPWKDTKDDVEPTDDETPVEECDLTKIDGIRKYLSEDHEKWKNEMKQSEVGGQIGGKETAHKGNSAMGCADDPDALKSPAGHKEAILKASNGKITCCECNGEFDVLECISESGSSCPDCGADVYNQILESVGMDAPVGKGLATKSTEKTDGRSSGSDNVSNNAPTGKGVATKTLTKSDGKSGGGGNKENMDQEGESVAEGQFKSPTKKYNNAGLKKNDIKEDIQEDTTVLTTSKDTDFIGRLAEVIGNEIGDDIGDIGDIDVDDVDDVGEPIEDIDVVDDTEGLVEPGTEEDVNEINPDDIPPIGDIPEAGIEEAEEGEEAEEEVEEAEEEIEGAEEELEDAEEEIEGVDSDVSDIADSLGDEVGEEEVGEEEVETDEEPITEDNDITSPNEKAYVNDKPENMRKGKKPKLKEIKSVGKAE